AVEVRPHPPDRTDRVLLVLDLDEVEDADVVQVDVPDLGLERRVKVGDGAVLLARQALHDHVLEPGLPGRGAGRGERDDEVWEIDRCVPEGERGRDCADRYRYVVRVDLTRRVGDPLVHGERVDVVHPGRVDAIDAQRE